MIAIDGKTLRRSFDDAARGNPLAVVTAFVSFAPSPTALRLVVGQHGYRVAEGDSEILAACALLECLDLKGHLVTADAIHCQAETARLIRARRRLSVALERQSSGVARHGRGLFRRPGNPGWAGLRHHHRCQSWPDETRSVWVSHDLGWMRGAKTSCAEPVMLPDMACLGVIEATVERRGKTTVTRHYHLASRTLDPAAYLQAARDHWAVENGLHWVLDVTFDEDRARNRKDNRPENLATVRKLALNILNRARRDISIPRKRKRSGWSDDFARTILGQMR